ncbi:NAD-dependent epimerase/dehydratase family protein [Acidobacteria bacterium AB60]|nr:NAD-dependent epimerase/dehydratase family protein [Acidobacteria bacterium AB60]
MGLTTILGAGGTIANGLAGILAADKRPLRLVSRNPKPMSEAELMAADLSDREQTIRAVAGSEVVHLLAGLKYDTAVWRETWPRIMGNVIEACKRAQAKLLFFDNVYMYGRVAGPMTEQTPYNPCSKKGEIRAHIATMLMDEVKAGSLQGMIARAPDFYGPDTPNSVGNVLVFGPLAKGSAASCMVNADVPHSVIYTPDAARGVALLADRASAWNQVWHLPTVADPPTGRQFIEAAAKELGVAPKFRVLSPLMLKVFGWFNPQVGEMYEMLYQNDSPYLFDSSKFAREFGFGGTPYAEGIKATAASYKKA